MPDNSPSITQGNNFKRQLKKINKHRKNRIQKTTKPNIESPSWFEGFGNLEDIPDNQSIFALRDLYNKTMHQYAATFAQYVDGVNQSSGTSYCMPASVAAPPGVATTPSCTDKTETECPAFANCTLVTPTDDVDVRTGWINGHDGNKYWLNDFQYLRKFASSNANENHVSCGGGAQNWNVNKQVTEATYSGQNAVADIDENSRLHGKDIGLGEPCDIEGKMITNKDNQNKKYAWIDQTGKAHLYTKQSWEKRAETCKGITGSDYHEMDSDAMFDHVTSTALPKSRYSKCDREVATSILSTKDELIRLTTELISIAGQIETEINRKSEANAESNKANTEELKDSITELEREKDQLETSLETLEGEYNDQKLHAKSAYYYYIAWTLGAVAVLGMTIYKINKK